MASVRKNWGPCSICVRLSHLFVLISKAICLSNIYFSLTKADLASLHDIIRNGFYVTLQLRDTKCRQEYKCPALIDMCVLTIILLRVMFEPFGPLCLACSPRYDLNSAQLDLQNLWCLETVLLLKTLSLSLSKHFVKWQFEVFSLVLSRN